MKHVENNQKSRQVPSQDRRTVAQDHLQVSARTHSFGQGIANNFTKTRDKNPTMTFLDLVSAAVAVSAFLYALKGYDLQMKTMKAVKKHFEETGRAGGQEHAER